MNEKKLINEIQTIDFDDIISNPQTYTTKQIYVVYYNI
jgi:hypothetical protein